MLRTSARTRATLLDQPDDGVILTDDSARPIYVNDRALRIVAEADGLNVRPSGLTAATPSATKRLRDAIAELGKPRPGEDSGDDEGEAEADSVVLCLGRPSLRPPLILTLVSMRRIGAAMHGAPASGVSIFVRESDVPMFVEPWRD